LDSHLPNRFKKENYIWNATIEAGLCPLAIATSRAPTLRLNQQEWYLAEVNIQGEELQPVFKRGRGDPDVIARNGPASLS
jgi:hypothetical protein